LGVWGKVQNPEHHLHRRVLRQVFTFPQRFWLLFAQKVTRREAKKVGGIKSRFPNNQKIQKLRRVSALFH